MKTQKYDMIIVGCLKLQLTQFIVTVTVVKCKNRQVNIVILATCMGQIKVNLYRN